MVDLQPGTASASRNDVHIRLHDELRLVRAAEWVAFRREGRRTKMNFVCAHLLALPLIRSVDAIAWAIWAMTIRTGETKARFTGSSTSAG